MWRTGTVWYNDDLGHQDTEFLDDLIAAVAEIDIFGWKMEDGDTYEVIKPSVAFITLQTVRYLVEFTLLPEGRVRLDSIRDQSCGSDGDKVIWMTESERDFEGGLEFSNAFSALDWVYENDLSLRFPMEPVTGFGSL